jgi:hypothetical protein
VKRPKWATVAVTIDERELAKWTAAAAARGMLLEDWIVEACWQALPDPDRITDEQWRAMMTKAAGAAKSKPSPKRTRR